MSRSSPTGQLTPAVVLQGSDRLKPRSIGNTEQLGLEVECSRYSVTLVYSAAYNLDETLVGSTSLDTSQNTAHLCCHAYL